MLRSKNPNPSEDLKLQAYNLMRQELEQENVALMKERQQLHKRSPNQPIASHGLSSDNEQDEDPPAFRSSDGSDPGSQIQAKIKQVIMLCKQGQRNNKSFKEIQEAEKNILNYLTTVASGPGLDSTPKNEESRKLVKSQSKSRINSENIKMKISQRGYEDSVTNQLMAMIEQIEAKALMEIQSLRNDKIILMKKLNQQIRVNNASKKRKSETNTRAHNQRSQVNQRPMTRMPSTIREQQQQYSNPSSSYAEQAQPQPANQPSRNSPSKNNQQSRKNIQNSGDFMSPPQRAPINNARPYLQRVQSVSYNQYGRPQSAIVDPNSQVEIENEISRLQRENSQMRETLTRNGSPLNSPIKAYLINELRDLEAKATKYEQILSKSRHLPRQNRTNGAQVETLLLQGANLAEQGQRLMRVRSKPEIRAYPAPYDIEVSRNQGLNEISEIRRPTRTTLEYEVYEPSSNRKKDGVGYQTGQFPINSYQNLIEQMKRITNS